jgi:hypothetical protein
MPSMTETEEKTEEKKAANKPWIITTAELNRVIREDRNRTRRLASLLAFALVAAAAGLVVGAVLLDREAYAVPSALIAIAAAFFVAGGLVAPAAVFALHRGRTRRWKQRQRECLELATITRGIKAPALGNLISFNFRLMDRFTAVAIGQARASYAACLAAAVAALFVLLLGATVVMMVDALGGQVALGVLTAVGAALASYISVTFLRTFELTSKQMSYYYGQPLVHCYLLHAEWLGERFEKDADAANRWKIRYRLIDAALNASRNAQNHLLDLQLPAPRRQQAPVPPPAALQPLAWPLVKNLEDGNGARQAH